MLHLHFANRLETLTALLLARLGRGPADVFAAEQLIVPSTALRRHLSLAIAAQRGICAQVQFSYLAQWLWQQMGRCVPGVAAESPYAPPVLTWRVHGALCDAQFVAAHVRLASYLQGADEVMRHDLARRVAGLLDQLLTYRSDWLQAWLQGRSVLPADAGASERADERWQAALWRRLSAESTAEPAAEPAGAAHPPLELLAAFVAALDQGSTQALALRGLPAQAHVFALPTMPPLHVQLLQHLGRHVDLHLYVLNPCREYWFELIDARRLSHLAARGRALGHEVGNRLLAGWGKQTQSHIDTLVESGGEAVTDEGHYEPHPAGTLLARLHNAILELDELAPGSVSLAADDRSIELHVCHSPTRELEVLHDHLLGLFKAAEEAGQPLQPGQVLVVTPDLEAAAPLIDAVFATAPPARRIPYTVTGRARSRANAPARALLELLALLASRCAASEVFGLLQQPLVARRFGLDGETLPQVHAWMQAAGMRWALDAAHRATFDVPADARHTLDQGLQRLFLGYALPTQTAEPFAGLLPAGDAEGADALALGALQRYLGALRALHAAASVPHAPAAWADLLRGAMDDFMQAEGDDTLDLRELRATVHDLAATMARGGASQPLPLAVLRAALTQALDDPARGGVPTGRVTFSAMSSLRNLPYAVVCAIGLNDGAFPGPERPLEFDLIARHPRRGDRQRRSDERNLFLDLLLAARHGFYLSHTGRSVRDNSPLPPSVLVSELLEVLVPAIASDPRSPAALAAARRRLVVEHPLQAFAAEGFTPGGEPRLRSFNQELAEALRGSLRAQAEAVPAALTAAHADARPATAGDGDGDRVDAGLGVGVGDRDRNGDGTEVVTEVATDGAAGGDAPETDEADEDEAADGAAEPLAPFFRAPLAAPGPEWHEVQATQLAEFFRNPCRALLRRRINLALQHDEDELQDDEPFLPGWPGRSALAARLLPALLQGADESAVRQLALAGTEWPAGRLGQTLLHTELATLGDFAAQVRQAIAAPCLPPHQTTLTYPIAGQSWRLHAGWADLRPTGLVRWHYDETRAGDYLQAWLQHLMLAADPPPGAAVCTRWISRDGEFSFGPVDGARTLLGDLLQLYRRGLSEPLHFFPKSAWRYMRSGGRRSHAIAAWRSTRQRPHGEESGAAYVLALRGVEDPLDAEFEALSAAVFSPLLAHLRDPRLDP